MYLYRGFHDPIQMITGDAYAALCTNQSHEISQPEEIEALVREHICELGATGVANTYGLASVTVCRYAKRMGFRRVGAAQRARWIAPEGVPA